MIDSKLFALAREIVKDLALETAGTWNIQGEDNSGDRLLLVNRAGLKMHLGVDWKSRKNPFEEQRLTVQTWAWPTWIDYQENEPRTQNTSPRDLYNPEESSPSISILISRGSGAIAREIKRRFLPDYQRIYARLAEVAREREAYAQKARDTWRAVCALISASPNHRSAYVDVKGVHLRIENRGATAHIEADVSAEQFAAIFKALQGLKSNEV